MYYKNQAIDVKSTGHDTFAITVPFKNGFRSFESNAAIVAFLKDLPTKIERNEILERICLHFNLSTEEAIAILDKQLLKSDLLLDTDQSTLEKKKHNGVLLFRKKLLGAAPVNNISRLFTLLCSKPIVLLFGAASILFQLWLLMNVSLQQVFNDNLNSRPLTAFLLVVAGLLFHEFGHAASAFRYGCRKVTIGFGWYVIYFVMLADLSESWTLERRKRLLISLAGGYFQSLYIFVLGLLWLTYQSQPCLIAASVLTVYNLLNLNPFFRLDGYWIVSDLLNIKNLREKAAQLAKNLLSRPSDWRISLQKSGYSLGLYTLGLIIFLPLFYSYVFLKLVPYSFANLSNEMNTLFNNTEQFNIGYNLIVMFFNLMILAFAAILIKNLLKKLWKKVPVATVATG